MAEVEHVNGVNGTASDDEVWEDVKKDPLYKVSRPFVEAHNFSFSIKANKYFLGKPQKKRFFS